MGHRKYVAPKELESIGLIGSINISPLRGSQNSSHSSSPEGFVKSQFLAIEKRMANNQVRKKRPVGKGHRSRARHVRSFDPDHLALPQDEIRRLVVRSTIRYRIEPFVKQMVGVMDNLKAGRIRNVARLTVSK